jgi:hypothetical protein
VGNVSHLFNPRCIKAALEEALQAEERSKPGLKATLKRIATMKIDPEHIAKLVRDIDNAYKRFSVSNVSILKS